MRPNEVVAKFKRFGTVKTCQDLALRTANRIVPVKVLKGVKTEAVAPEFLKCDVPYLGRFLGEAELAETIRNRPEYEMSADFLSRAFGRGDRCYGFMDGPVLAAYGWYSNRPTEIDTPGMMLHFNDSYVYMYKGFTHEKYRGQRLHAIAMTRALEFYLSKGYKGFISYVEWNNFGSLKSCYRMGYEDIGNICVARLFGRYVTYADRGTSKYGFHLEYTGAAVSGERVLTAIHDGRRTPNRIR